MWCCVHKEGLGNWKHTRRERGPVSDPDSAVMDREMF